MTAVLWSLVTPETMSVLSWPDGVVLYDARTSTTRLLAPRAGAIVARLKAGPADVSVLAALQPTDDVALPELLDALARYGIVRAAD
ncbi:HPr-rel-A system PqqD family peptide chaperone [Methyloversatilis sp.]|uniref:HPr-rel-A system PqqD family peptide chaperone n=1 Tax=Methyloversatilis sp. TaxID=2569862 RepID=UPI003D2A77BA